MIVISLSKTVLKMSKMSLSKSFKKAEKRKKSTTKIDGPENKNWPKKLRSFIHLLKVIKGI